MQAFRFCQDEVSWHEMGPTRCVHRQHSCCWRCLRLLTNNRRHRIIRYSRIHRHHYYQSSFDSFILSTVVYFAHCCHMRGGRGCVEGAEPIFLSQVFKQTDNISVCALSLVQNRLDDGRTNRLDWWARDIPDADSPRYFIASFNNPTGLDSLCLFFPF